MAQAIVRSALFVPASRAERIPKALASGADAVIVDLEDAVEPAAKPAARQALAEFLNGCPDARVWVRVNDATTPWHEDDLAALRGKPGVAAVMLPKAESAAQVAHAGQGRPVVPIVETARGLVRVAEVAAAPGVDRLAFGSLDYGVDLSFTPATAAADVLLGQARGLVLLHSRAAGLAAPMDGVYPDIEDTEGLSAAAERASHMGFSGMLCIHPSQIETVHAAFMPAQADIDWSRRVLTAQRESGAGAFRLEGRMVDAPVLARARQVLARAGITA
ncbi:CoA ester lyase [Bordetella sp. FB-8]|uniref:HpcH/HpaI aldolase/citrate lyase family protein n=1 Tax=Bordetella sp. FB-8 TaxID=1159870 RepID=UPI00036CD7D8|nr:CoA ester lyase [Bordetella sp. FB-8]